MKALAVGFLALFLASGPASADALSQLPPAWSQRLLPLPAQNLSALDAGVQARIARVRAGLNRLLQNPNADPGEIAEAWGKLGALSQVYRMQTAARIAFENAHRLAPDDFRWLYYLAWVEASLGDYARALPLFEQAARLKPDYAPLILRRADALRGLDRLDEARALYLQARKRPGLEAAADAGLAQIALAQRDFERAARLFDKALKLDPKADGLHYPMAQALLQLGKRREARALLAHPGHTPPKVADPLIAQLDALQQDARSDYHQAMVALRKQDYARAVEYFEKGLKKEGDNPRAAISLARTRYLLDGDADHTRAELARIVQRHPEATLARFLLAVLDDAADHTRRAEAGYREVLRQDPDHEGANLFLARSLYRRRQYADAARYFDHLIELGSENPMIWWFDLLSHIGARDEPPGKIITRIEQATEKFPENRMFQNLLIDRLLAQNTPEGRERALKQARALAATHPIPPVHTLLARVLAANGRFDEAVAYQQAVVDFERQQGQDPKRLQALEKALDDYRNRRPPPRPRLDPSRFQVPPVDRKQVLRNYKAARPY